MPAKEEKRGGLGRVGRELELGPNAYIAKVGSERVRALARRAFRAQKEFGREKIESRLASVREKELGGQMAAFWRLHI